MRFTPKLAAGLFLIIGIVTPPTSAFQQPTVQPGPSEPDWLVILDRYYHTSMLADLANPVTDNATAVPGLFRKAGSGPVRFVPEMALGLEVEILGGFYFAAPPDAIDKQKLWSYQHKSSARELEDGSINPPPLAEGSKTSFDPGDQPFGLFIGNAQFVDSVFTQPAAVAALNPRLAAQPYKVMIYPYRDPKSGMLIPNSYLLGWEYSTNDDFQDVVCRIENVRLVNE